MKRNPERLTKFGNRSKKKGLQRVIFKYFNKKGEKMRISLTSLRAQIFLQNERKIFSVHFISFLLFLRPLLEMCGLRVAWKIFLWLFVEEK